MLTASKTKVASFPVDVGVVIEIKESIKSMTTKYQAEVEQLKIRLKNESTK